MKHRTSCSAAGSFPRISYVFSYKSMITVRGGFVKFIYPYETKWGPIHAMPLRAGTATKNTRPVFLVGNGAGTF